MFKRFRTAVLALATVTALGLGLALSQPAAANQSPAVSYCQPLGATDNVLIGTGVGLLENGVGCTLQPGDIFADGPMYPASFTWGGFSRVFVIPAMVWITKGNRAYTAATGLTAPASTTTYYFIECNLCSGEANATWETNTTSSPPDAYAELMYTITANGTGITAVTNPTPAVALFNSATVSGIENTGLGASTTLPLCAPNNAAESQCGAGSIPDADLVTAPITSLTCTVNISCAGSAVTGSNTPVWTGLATAGNLLDSGLGSSSVLPLCGANATNQSQCGSASIPNADLVTAAVTALTAGTNITVGSGTTPSVAVAAAPSFSNLTDAGVGSTSTLPWCGPNNAAVAQCSATSIPDADLVTAPLTSLTCTVNIACVGGNVTGSNTPTWTGLATAGNLKDTGLPSATVGPLCGASGTNESQCATTPLFGTTGNQAVNTGTTANTYIQIGSTVSLTATTSGGPTGKWLAVVTMAGTVGAIGLTTEYLTLCAVSASTFTVEDAQNNGSTTCLNPPTNKFFGGPGWGSVTSPDFGLSQTNIAHLEIANGATLAISFWVEGSTTTSASCLNCYGSVELYPI